MAKIEGNKDVRHNSSYEILTAELSTLDQMLHVKSEFRDLLAQVYKVVLVLHRLGCQEDKIYSLDKEEEMKVEVKLLKDSYGRIGGLVVSCISGGLSIVGGVIGITSAFPGTAVGNALGKLPGLKSFFSVTGAGDMAKRAAELAQKISGFSNSIATVGNGVSSFGKIDDQKGQAEQAEINFLLQQMQRKNEDRRNASQEEKRQAQEALQNNNRTESEWHSIFAKIVEVK